MGKPITPRPRKATLAMFGTLSVVWVYGSCQARGARFRYEGGLGAHHKPLRREGNGFVWQPVVLRWRTSRTSKQGSKAWVWVWRSEEHTSELQSRQYLV